MEFSPAWMWTGSPRRWGVDTVHGANRVAFAAAACMEAHGRELTQVVQLLPPACLQVIRSFPRKLEPTSVKYDQVWALRPASWSGRTPRQTATLIAPCPKYRSHAVHHHRLASVAQNTLCCSM